MGEVRRRYDDERNRIHAVKRSQEKSMLYNLLFYELH